MMEIKYNSFVTLWIVVSGIIASLNCVASKRIGESYNFHNGNLQDKEPDSDVQHHRRTQFGNSGQINVNLVVGGGFTIIDPECFSSNAFVDVWGVNERVSVRDIQVGDQVLTSTGEYETVYTIDHRHPTKTTEFVQIHSELADIPLELTARHMVFVQGNSIPKPAASVKIGDVLQTLQGGSTVTRIEAITRDGLFSPLTSSGNIIVNGIVASTYSAFLSNNEWIEIAGMKLMSHQMFFDTILKPYKLLCTEISLDLCKTTNEKTIASQMLGHTYVVWSQQNQTFQLTSILLFMTFLQFLAIISNPYYLALFFCLGSSLIFRNERKKSKQKLIEAGNK